MRGHPPPQRGGGQGGRGKGRERRGIARGGGRGDGRTGRREDGQAAAKRGRTGRTEDGQAEARGGEASGSEPQRGRGEAEDAPPTISTRPKAACPIHLYTGGKGRGFAKFTPVILYGGRKVFTFVNIKCSHLYTDILSVYICKPWGGLRPPRGQSGSGGGQGRSGQLRPANAP